MDFQIEDYADDTLDQFSTSHTALSDLCFSFPRCEYGAPYFAFCRGGARYSVVQGCCNHWECRRCGLQVAKGHYGRIVEGARQLAKGGDLWFVTVTCRGADLSESEATRSYLSWTGKFLNACRMKASRSQQRWSYVQVTEKQRRGHPHSHILTTFNPDDLVEGAVEKWETDNAGRNVMVWKDALRSEWMQEMVCRAGLGDQYDISKVETVEGASRYVAKYMFKKSQFEAHYPKGWKRVRYAQSWPKMAEVKTDAFVLLGSDDWRHLQSQAAVVDAESGDAFEAASFYLHHSDTIVIEARSRHVDEGENRDYAAMSGFKQQ